METEAHVAAPPSDQKLETLEATTYKVESPERTFGHSVVVLMNRHAAVMECMGDFEAGSDEYIAYATKGSQLLLYDLKGELHEVRKRLTSLTPDAEKVMEEYLDYAVPEYMSEAMDQRSKDLKRRIGWKEWLSSKADDDELINILQWHNYTIEQQAKSERVSLAYEVFKHFFITGVQTLYEKDDIAFPLKRLDNIELVVGDIFDTFMSAEGRIGYFMPGTSEINVAQGQGIHFETQIRELVENFPLTIIHELVHATLCTSYEPMDTPLASRWMNEALTEELSAMIRQHHGIRLGGNEAYIPERQLLEFIISKSPNQRATQKLATHAYTGEKKDRLAFVQHIDALWNARDVLQKINIAIMTEEGKLRQNGMTNGRSINATAVENVHALLRDNPEALLHREAETMLGLPRLDIY
jgi:hypothetical protein